MKVSRRKALQIGAAASVAIMAPRVLTARAEFNNEPKGSSVTLGAISPQTGPFAHEGSEALRGFTLAVRHINDGGGGMLETFGRSNRSGSGILGKKIEWVSGDSQSKPDAARASAKGLVEKDGAVACFGGSAIGVTLAMQSYFSDAGISYFPGTMNGLRFTSQFTYRFAMTGPVATSSVLTYLEKQHSSEIRFATLVAPYSYGWAMADQMESASLYRGWENVGRATVALGSSEATDVLSFLKEKRPDVLLIASASEHTAKALSDLAPFIRNKGIQIATPVIDRRLIALTGENGADIVGASDWAMVQHHVGAAEFQSAYGNFHGFPPSPDAYIAYAQVLLYSDAVERAGSFHPEAVREALEEYKFSGLGCGSARMSDYHELEKPIIIARITGRMGSWEDAIEVLDICPSCGVSAPETCSQQACAQGYCCKDGKCVKC